MDKKNISTFVIPSFIQNLGVTPEDSPEAINSKKMLVLLAVFMSLGGVVWGTLLILFDLFYPMLIPYGYVILSGFNLLYLHHYKKISFPRFFQITISLLLPFALQWLLGGFVASGIVMLWAVLSLIGSIILFRGKYAYGWLIFFIFLTIVSFLLESYTKSIKPSILTVDVSQNLMIINILMIMSIVFVLSKVKLDNDLLIKAELKVAYEKLHIIKEEIQIKSELLSDAFRDITNSIKYAERIQKAMLGNPQDLTRQFKQAFVFFKPRDVISGDFFWHSTIQATPEDNLKKLIVVADCTGHGVPGAFMTMMGSALLDEIVNEKQISEPSDILYEMDRKVIANLQKSGKDNQVNDGMDLAVLIVDETNNEACFAGAKLPLWYVSDGELHVIKGSKFPIGSTQYRMTKEFECNIFKFKPQTTFYLFSDGFQDQFGGKEGKKYLRKNFRSFLLNISAYPCEEQKDKLEKELVHWQETYAQTDDILVIGVQA